MGTSFVEYKEKGFWTRDSFLESWLTAMLEELKKLPAMEPWHQSLAEHWSLQVKIDGGWMSVNLDEFAATPERVSFLIALANKALERAGPSGRRTGELFIELLEGKLKTTVSSPIDYL